MCNMECCSGRRHLKNRREGFLSRVGLRALQVATCESDVSRYIPMSLQAASRNWNSGVTPPHFGGCNGVSERRPLRMRGATAPDYVPRDGVYCRQYSDLGLKQAMEYCEYQRSVYNGDQYVCTYSSRWCSHSGVSTGCNAARRSSRPCSTS